MGKKIWIGLLVIIVVLVFVIGGVSNFKHELAISNLDTEGSDKYLESKEKLKGINEGWLEMELEMEAWNKSEEDIAQARIDFFEFMSMTLLLSIQSDSSLSDIEKEALIRELVKAIPEDAITKVDKNCPYTEEMLPLQDIFKGTTLKFSEPMLYLDWDNPIEKGCTPTQAQADYLLESVDSWDRTHFDKSDIGEISVDPNTTFTVEGRILVKRGGLFESEFEHYILRDSNGVLSVPTYMVFDTSRYDNYNGSYLYKDGEYFGHVIYDVWTDIVWIEEDGVPAEVVEYREARG